MQVKGMSMSSELPIRELSGVRDPAPIHASFMPYSCYDRGMARTRISTTVDSDLLANARQIRSGLPDSTLVDEALAALVARHRGAEIDAAYAAYDEHPLDERDEWGDLASFRSAAGTS